MYKRQYKLERYIEGLELQTDRVQEHNTFVINENTVLKEKIETITKTIKDIEWAIDAICGYIRL